MERARQWLFRPPHGGTEYRALFGLGALLVAVATGDLLVSVMNGSTGIGDVQLIAGPLVIALWGASERLSDIRAVAAARLCMALATVTAVGLFVVRL